MNEERSWSDLASRAMGTLESGAFLTAGRAGSSNTMTIGWGSVGVFWRKPVFTVWVRPTRYTYEFMESGDEFTVSLPEGDLREALALCGTKSGRDTDKIAAAGLTLKAAKKVAAPIVADCKMYYECKLLYKQALLPEGMPESVKEQIYPLKDYHVMYVGEIVAAYEE